MSFAGGSAAKEAGSLCAQSLDRYPIQVMPKSAGPSSLPQRLPERTLPPLSSEAPIMAVWKEASDEMYAAAGVVAEEGGRIAAGGSMPREEHAPGHPPSVAPRDEEAVGCITAADPKIRQQLDEPAMPSAWTAEASAPMPLVGHSTSVTEPS